MDRSTPVTRLSLEGTTGEYTVQGERQLNHGPVAPTSDSGVPDITMQNVVSSTNLIPDIEDIPQTSTVVTFGESSRDKVELHILNLKNVLLESSYDTPYQSQRNLTNTRSTTTSTSAARTRSGTPGVSQVPNINIDLHNIFRDLGYISGKFKFRLNLHRNLLGSRENPVEIRSISDDRTELSISFRGVSYLETAKLVDQFGNRTEFYLNFRFNNLIRIAGFVADLENTTTRELVYTVTLQSPLPGELGPQEICWIDQQVADPVIDSISIVPKKKQDPIVNLRNPNFNVDIDSGLGQATAFKSWDALLGSNPTSSQQLINNLLGSKVADIDLNVDYRDYSNFVFYGSAVDKLNGFRYKIGLVEYYDGITQNLNTLTQTPEVTNNLVDISTKKNNLLSGFDGYEKYLYYESSSYESSSYGEFFPTTWPKQNDVKPYVNFSITSSEGQAWYFGQLESASIFDKRNFNSLNKTIPEFIREDISNDVYTTFVNMVGHHFDIIRSYVEQIPNIHSRKEPLYEGLAKDLVYHVLGSLGIDAINGFNVQDLWLSTLGVNQSGNYTQSGSLFSIPTDDIVKETWKRILNNLPYLLKTKGTGRGIRALLNCYGVPSTIYRIKEYSGPYQYDSKTITRRDRYQRKDKFTLALHLTGSELISVAPPGGASGTLQYRFKPSYSPATQTISTSPVQILLRPSGSSRTIGLLTVGGVDFSASFYDKWTSVSINSGKTYILQNRDGVINFYLERPLGLVSSVQLGSSNCNFDVQEIRYWKTALDETAIKEYCLNPQTLAAPNTVGSYAASGWQFNPTYNFKSAYENLLARYPLGSTLQLWGTSSIHPDRSLSTNVPFLSNTITTASFVGNEEVYYCWLPNTGDSLDLANKIRIEENRLDGQLSPYNSVEKSQYDTYQLDSPKVGVFFSPQDEINEDISDQFPGLLLDDIIGDPRDDYNDKYTGLEVIREHYQQKYTDRNQIWKYVRLVENFDASMFYLIKKFLPARAAKMVGLVIQPNILERPKTFRHPLGIERMDYLTQIPMTYYEFEAEYPTYEGNYDVTDDVIFGDYVTYEDSVFATTIDVEGSVEIYEGTIPNAALQNTIHAGMDNIMDPAYDGYLYDDAGNLVPLQSLKYMPASKFNALYGGCKISSPGFNIPSPDTFDGAPVIEYWTTNPGTTGNTGNPLIPLGTLSGPVAFNPQASAE